MIFQPLLLEAVPAQLPPEKALELSRGMLAGLNRAHRPARLRDAVARLDLDDGSFNNLMLYMRCAGCCGVKVD